MSGRRSRWSRCALGVFALVGTTAPSAVSQEPSFVRALVLPVAEDIIGYPRGVTADLHTGEVFVCDTRLGRILIFDAEGLFLHEITGGDRFSGPRDVAVDPDGFLVVAANRRARSTLLELDFDGLFRREIALSGLPEGAGEPRITSVALSRGGDRVYALDPANLRLWISQRDGVVVSSVDLAAGLSERQRRDLILGQVDVYGDTVLVAVPSSAQIRAFDLEGEPRGVLGKRGTAPCTVAFPVAAALAENGEVVIVDQQRMLVLRWNLRSNRCLGEYIGFGAAPGFLYFPMDLALDGSGHVFVSQGFEGRVQMYEGMTPAAGPKRAP